MKTRNRILLTSLELFNIHGEPNVTTIDIANEMEISPGNLYYHFRNKDEIIFELFLEFERCFYETLQTPLGPELDMMDYWLFTHLIYEKIWEYRFLYRDPTSILERNSKLQKRFNRILDKKQECCTSVIQALRQRTVISITDNEAKQLTNQIILNTTFWLNFQQIRQFVAQDPATILDYGVYHTLSLFTPYLTEEAKEILAATAATYLGDELDDPSP